MSDYRACCDASARGSVLRVEVSPRARRTAVAGVREDALRVRVAAPPVDGKANRALLDWLGGALGLRAGRLRLVAGDRARRKTVEVPGLSPDEVAERLSALG